MKIAYFDCEFGAAGDMLVGSLLSAGASLDYLKSELTKLNLASHSFELREEQVVRCSIACKKFNVLVGSEKIYEDGLYLGSPALVAGVKGDAQPAWQVVDKNSTPAARGDVSILAEESESLCPRTLTGIATLLEASELSPAVKKLASEIFEKLFSAEASCQGVEANCLQMNDLMAMDAIIDIVSFAIAYASLEIEKTFVSSLPLGVGSFNRDGILHSAAAPATVQLLKEAGAPVSANKFDNECLTPTGAAILCSVVAGWGLPELQRLTGTGYGAGSYNPSHYPNAVRVLMGVAPEQSQPASEALAQKSVASRFQSENIIVMDANIDDLSPQTLAYATERLLESGALDVLVVPATMKKGRSGHLLKVLCTADTQANLQEIMFTETSTIGVRFYTAQRVIANREWCNVVLDDGAIIRVKIARDLVGLIVHTQPEFEDCSAYARKHNMPLKSLMAMVLLKFEAINGSGCQADD